MYCTRDRVEDKAVRSREVGLVEQTTIKLFD